MKSEDMKKEKRMKTYHFIPFLGMNFFNTIRGICCDGILEVFGDDVVAAETNLRRGGHDGVLSEETVKVS